MYVYGGENVQRDGAGVPLCDTCEVYTTWHVCDFQKGIEITSVYTLCTAIGDILAKTVRYTNYKQKHVSIYVHTYAHTHMESYNTCLF